MHVTLEQSIALLKQGSVVAIPTETVYGLAADARNETALKEIYAIKERPANNPLIVHIGSAEQVEDWASEYSPLAQKLAEGFWPGPFTLVLPAQESVSNIVRAGESTVALRVPAHPVAQQVLQQSGLGLAAPSANKYTQLSPTTPAHVTQSLGESVAVLDGGACQVGIESTIVSVNGDEWQLLRHGMVTEAQIEQVSGKPAQTSPKAVPKAPGQHLLHYAPKTSTHLFDDISALNAFAKTHANCIALTFGDEPKPDCEYEALPNSAKQSAEQLYQTLHALDALGKSHILIAHPPKHADWLAIIDRLNRATHRGTIAPSNSE